MIPPLNPLPVWLSFVSFISVWMHFDRQFTIPGQDLLYVSSNISVKQQLLFQTQAIIVRTFQTIIIKIIQQMNLNEHENLFTVIFFQFMYLDEKNQQKILSMKNSYIAVMIVRGSQNAFWQTHILAHSIYNIY